MKLLPVLAALLVIPVARGQDSDPRIDSDTGAETNHYPPARPFDHLHMKLEMDIPDMEKAFFTAHETLTLTPIGRARKHLDLNAIGQKIEKITVDGASAQFTHEKGRLSIDFPKDVPLGKNAELAIDFSLDFTKGPHEQGLTYLQPRTSETANATDKSPVIYSQGEAEYNRRWFPCHDFPNERLTTEIVVTVEDGYTVVSNGHLVGSTKGTPSGETTRTTWHWLQDKPHANYLVTLVIGKYSLVGLPPETPEKNPKSETGTPISCYLYAPIGRETAAAASFAHTPSILAYYNEQFGQAYAWDKYAQVLVRGFNGGMENTSATTMMAGLAGRRASQADDIISHEAGHQWFGDLMTCKSWEHAWLNEGWASYCEALWARQAAKAEDRDDAYQGVIAGFYARQRINNTHSPDTPAMVSNRYEFPMQNFMKTNDIYSKGGLVLHMLKMRLGEEAFWKGVRAYIQKYKYKEVETDNFRQCLEEASGLDLSRFFDQWCYRPGMPRLDVELDWKDGANGGGDLTVSLKQTQHLDADNPAYSFSLPIYVSYKNGGSEWLLIDMDTKTASGTWTLKAKPEDVDIDPDMKNCVNAKIRKPLAMWLKQAGSRSVFAQMQAAEHLAAFDDTAAALALARMAGDPARAPTVREFATAGLMNRARATTLAVLNLTRPFALASIPSAN